MGKRLEKLNIHEQVAKCISYLSGTKELDSASISCGKITVDKEPLQIEIIVTRKKEDFKQVGIIGPQYTKPEFPKY